MAGGLDAVGETSAGPSRVYNELLAELNANLERKLHDIQNEYKNEEQEAGSASCKATTDTEILHWLSKNPYNQDNITIDAYKQHIEDEKSIQKIKRE